MFQVPVIIIVSANQSVTLLSVFVQSDGKERTVKVSDDDDNVNI